MGLLIFETGVLSLFSCVVWLPILEFAHLKLVYWFSFFSFPCVLYKFKFPFSSAVAFAMLRRELSCRVEVLFPSVGQLSRARDPVTSLPLGLRSWPVSSQASCLVCNFHWAKELPTYLRLLSSDLVSSWACTISWRRCHLWNFLWVPCFSLQLSDSPLYVYITFSLSIHQLMAIYHLLFVLLW